uniref:galactose-binding domain-containing protein n=1 Tax=Frankia tisae TaxID=2950104 RepID=UPI0021BE4854
MCEFDDLIDIAPRGKATQSSLSQWSLPDGAQALVQPLHQDFLIHTEFELNPWWQIDLRNIFPLNRIIIGNRREVTYQERACHLRVEASVDGHNWQF